MAVLIFMGGIACAAMGQNRGSGPDLAVILDDFEEWCRAMNVRRDSGADAFTVYAHTTISLRWDPTMGDRPQVVGETVVSIFDNEQAVSTARREYKKLRETFRRHGGDSAMRDFAFEDRSWQFDCYEHARAKARELRRKSLIDDWPGVLELAVHHSTEADRYFVFAYRPLSTERKWDDDEYELSFYARKQNWEFVVFDDEEIADAAKKAYRDYIGKWSRVNDGRGNAVGEAEFQTEPFNTYPEATKRIEVLRKKLIDQLAHN